MESVTMMALGSYRFSVSTAAYQELERQNEWRWQSIDRIGAKPAQQFTGPGATTITMRGAIYPAFARQRRGLDQLPQMRATADTGLPQLLVDGAGRVWGRFCIASIVENQTVFFADGTPRRIDFTIGLVEYGD